MIRSLLQTSFYFYLVFDFYYHEPSVFMLFFCMYFEIVLTVAIFVVLKFIADGWDALEYLAGIVGSSFPFLIIFFMMVFAGPEDSISHESKFTVNTLVRNAMIGVGINYAISLFYFLKNHGTESFYMANMFKKIFSLAFIFLVSFFVSYYLSNPNSLILVSGIVAMRFIIELMLTKTTFKAFKQ